jgi:hypothetical protein
VLTGDLVLQFDTHTNFTHTPANKCGKRRWTFVCVLQYAVTFVVSAWTRLSLVGHLVITVGCTGWSGMILVHARTDGHTEFCFVLRKEHVNTKRILRF